MLQKICPVCGKIFTTSYETKVYCCRRHKETAHKKRQLMRRRRERWGDQGTIETRRCLYCGKPFQVYKWQQKKYCCPKHKLADWPRIKALKRGIGVEKLYEGCVICGNKELPILEIHHKDGNRENKSPDNLVVLCPNCHKKVHRGIIKL